MKIEYTQQEATVLVQIIDLAVKSSGLQVAESAVILARRLTDAMSKDKAQNNEPIVSG